MRSRHLNSRLISVVVIVFLFYAYLRSLPFFVRSNDRGAIYPNTNNTAAKKFFNAPITCKPGEEKRNLVYAKVPKTGSDTLAQVFRAFGYTRNLTFVLPSKSYNGINWPDQVEPDTYYKSKTGTYNILCEHAVLNITKFKALMPRDTVYIASIREPFARFISAFNYFQVSRLINITDDIPARTFMTSPQYFDNVFKSECNRRRIYPAVLRNAMSFDLGFRMGHPEGSVDWTYDKRRIDHWLKQLDEVLDIVLINEHFDESMVLLRRRMCWSTKDIIYIFSKANNKKHVVDDVVFRSSTQNSSSVVDKFYMWSAVDVKLYEHFSAKLWQQVAELEDVDTFWDEVIELKAILAQVAELCAVNSTSNEVITLQAFDKTHFTVTRNECYLFTNQIFLRLIKAVEEA
jgi:hypothetical protein